MNYCQKSFIKGSVVVMVFQKKTTKSGSWRHVSGSSVKTVTRVAMTTLAAVQLQPFGTGESKKKSRLAIIRGRSVFLYASQLENRIR